MVKLKTSSPWNQIDALKLSWGETCQGESCSCVPCRSYTWKWAGSQNRYLETTRMRLFLFNYFYFKKFGHATLVRRPPHLPRLLLRPWCVCVCVHVYLFIVHCVSVTKPFITLSWLQLFSSYQMNQFHLD